MSVIFGKWQLDGRPLEAATLARMQARLNHWKADDQGLWQDASVGLGHLMLWNTPESLHEKLPLVSPRTGHVLTADARIDNRADLLTQLAITDHGVPDSTLILAAYERWGRDCVQHLIGDFAFVVWDAQREELFCARDHMGVKPFFYYWDGQTFAFASEMKGLLALDEVGDELCKNYVLDLLCSGVFVPEETCYKDIRVLPRAQAMTLRRGMIPAIVEYFKFDPDREIRYKNEGDYLEHFNALLTQAVERRLRSAYRVGIEMSGGLDSSGIAAVAVKRTPKAMEDLQFYSSVLPDAYHGKVYPFQDDRELIYAVRDFLEIPEARMTYFHSADERYLDNVRHALEALDGPMAKSTAAMTHTLARFATPDGTRSLLSGFPGDQVVTFRGNGYDEYLHRRRYWALYQAMPKSRKVPLIKPAFFKALIKKWRYGRYFDWNFIRSTDSILLKPQFITEAHRQKALAPYLPTSLQLSGQQIELLTMPAVPQRFLGENHVATQFRMEKRYPLADIDLLQYHLALPIEQKVHQGVARLAFRKSMEGILPHSVIYAPKSDIPTHASFATAIVNDIDNLTQFLKLPHQHAAAIDLNALSDRLQEAKESERFEGLAAQFFNVMMLVQHLDNREQPLFL